MKWLRHVLANPGWKLVSVLLATLVWLLVHYNITERQQPERRRTFTDVPITLLLRPGETHVPRLEPTTARVIVRGAAREVEGLSAAEVRVFADLSKTNTLPTWVEVDVHVPRGLTVVSLTPQQVRVHPPSSPPSS